MMQLMTQLSMMAAESYESTEERVQRLETTAADTDVDETTLYDVEEEVRRYAKHRLQSLEGEEAQQVEQLKQEAPAMLGVPADDVDDVAAVLIARMLVSEPKRVAEIVHNLDWIFQDTGLYYEMDVPTPSEDVLPDAVDLDAGALEDGTTEIPGADLDDAGADPSR